MPDALVDAGCVYPDEHVIVPDHRLVDLPKLQDVGRRPVPVLNHGPHDVESAGFADPSRMRARDVIFIAPR
jgi:hypothetical protein